MWSKKGSIVEVHEQCEAELSSSLELLDDECLNSKKKLQNGDTCGVHWGAIPETRKTQSLRSLRLQSQE